MTEAQRGLLKLLAHRLFGVPTAVMVKDGIILEAQAQAVSSIITKDYKTIGQNIRVLNAHAQLTTTLKDIPFTTFKGYASAYYYTNPSCRPMGDVDFIGRHLVGECVPVFALCGRGVVRYDHIVQFCDFTRGSGCQPSCDTVVGDCGHCARTEFGVR